MRTEDAGIFVGPDDGKALCKQRRPIRRSWRSSRPLRRSTATSLRSSRQSRKAQGCGPGEVAKAQPNFREHPRLLKNSLGARFHSIIGHQTRRF